MKRHEKGRQSVLNGVPLAVCALFLVFVLLLIVGNAFAAVSTKLPPYRFVAADTETDVLPAGRLNTSVYITSTVLLENVGGSIVELAPAFGGYLQYFTVLQEGDTYTMWLNSNKRSLPRQGVEQRFESQDGLIWSNRTDTDLDLPYGGDYEYVAGIREIIKEGDIYEAWESYYYEVTLGWAYAVRYVTSNDGLDWNVVAQPGLIGALSQNVMKQDSLYRMWTRVDVDAELYPNTPQLLRYRTSENGGSGWGDWLTGGQLVLLDSQSMDRGLSRVRQLPDGSYQLFYFHPDTGRIDRAASADGVHFVTQVVGLVDFDVIVPGWQVVLDFDVVEIDGEDWFYFTYRTEDGSHIGVTRPAFGVPFVDDVDYSVQYGGFAGLGGWIGVQDANAYGGGYRAAELLGKTISYKTAFPANAITLVTYRGPDQGKAYVFIDGQFRELVNLYSPLPTYQAMQEYSGLNPLQRHTITVIASGLKSPLSSGREVRVDGFADNGTVTDDNDLGIRYNLWNGTMVPAAYSGGFRQTVAPDATINFEVAGEAFTWLTLRCPMCGEAEIIIDGELQATVDTYHPALQFQYEELIAGLPPGPHMVTIRTLGTHNPDSSGTLIVFDGYAP